MRKTKTKLIKNIISYQKDDPTSKKLYRRLKKEYSSANTVQKETFIKNLKRRFENA